MRINDLLGKTFFRLTVIKRSDRKSSAGALWECRCLCGGETVTTGTKLKSGHTKSCGCRQKEIGGHNRTHGRSAKGDKTYKTWKEMRNRCKNRNAHNWKWYGGRGVRVCESWESFEKFLSDMGERPPNKTLDRINPDGNYEPGNCRWATAKEQAESNRGCFRKGMNKHIDGTREFDKVKGVETKGVSLK